MNKLQLGILSTLSAEDAALTKQIWQEYEESTISRFTYTSSLDVGGPIMHQWAMPAHDGEHEHYIDFDVVAGWRVAPWAPLDSMPASEFTVWSVDISVLEEARRLLVDRFGGRS